MGTRRPKRKDTTESFRSQSWIATVECLGADKCNTVCRFFCFSFCWIISDNLSRACRFNGGRCQMSTAGRWRAYAKCKIKFERNSKKCLKREVTNDICAPLRNWPDARPVTRKTMQKRSNVTHSLAMERKLMLVSPPHATPIHIPLKVNCAARTLSRPFIYFDSSSIRYLAGDLAPERAQQLCHRVRVCVLSTIVNRNALVVGAP